MDRQDIDALLIGALYGELTPADEARLTAHLESHPTDRGALDDLKVTRQAVLESRIFATQVEPPQAISALLLQEAHHRAPKRAAVATEAQRESWFYRFTRVFLAHPAMAAAAMLVLVLGGAALMSSNGKSASAKKELSQSTAENAAPASPAVADLPAATPPAGSGSAWGSAYAAGLYEGGEADGKDEAKAPADQGADKAAIETKEPEPRADTAVAQSQVAVKPKATHSMAVTTNKGSVKDLDRAGTLQKSDDSFGMLGGDSNGAPGGAGGGGAATGATIAAGPSAASGRGAATGGGYAQPPPAANKPMASAAPAPSMDAPTSPPEPKPVADSKTAAPAKVAATKSAPKTESAVKQDAKPADSSLIAWAKSEHARAVTLAQHGECSAAAKVALTVSSRASDYYAQYMATDRALKQCAQYINAEREKDAEKSAKARAQKRVNAEEPSAVSK